MDYDKVGFLAKFLYKHILRDILIKAIDDPEEEWDDAVLAVLDRVFGYTG